MSDSFPDAALDIALTPATPIVDSSQQVAALFDAHHQAIFGYLYRMIGNDRELAEELTQETFLKAFQARRQLSHIANQRAWLYRIATNLAINALKRRNRFRWLPWARATEVQSGQDAVRGAEMGVDLAQALGELPLSLRAPLLLSAVQGLSAREISQALDISEGAVRTRLYRAREKLRAIFQDEA